MPTTPSLFKSTGFSIHYAPCIAATATNAIGGDGNLTDMVESYSHEHSANNGFEKATIGIRGQWKDLEQWWTSGIGRDVQVFDYGLNTVWRGFVNGLSVSIGGLSASRGPLTDIANYAYCVYTIILDDSVVPIVTGGQTITTAATDADSAAKYGQWEKTLSGGTCKQTVAEAYRDTYLQENRYPIPSEELTLGQSSEAMLTIECLGYWAWLKAYFYSDANAGTRTVTTKLQDVLAADPNGIFSTDYSYLETNAFLASRNENDNPFAETVIKAEVAIGDVNNDRYTFGFWEDQIAWYRNVTNLQTKYEHYLTDDKIRVTEFGGATEVDYWNVRAGEWLFVVDFLGGQSPDTVDRRNDDRFIFAEKVGYTMPDQLSVNGMKISTLPQFLAKKGLGGSV